MPFLAALSSALNASVAAAAASIGSPALMALSAFFSNVLLRVLTDRFINRRRSCTRAVFWAGTNLSNSHGLEDTYYRLLNGPANSDCSDPAAGIYNYQKC